MLVKCSYDDDTTDLIEGVFFFFKEKIGKIYGRLI